MHHWDLSYEAAVLRYIKTWFRIEVQPHGAGGIPAIVKIRVMAYLPESLFRGSRQGLSLL